MSGRRPILVIEHEANTGLSLMAAPLAGRVEVARPYLGHRLPESAEYAGLIVLGGSMGAWDDDLAPWLPATRKLLADAVHHRVPTLGICLGAHLLAAATGGTVERGSAGLEIGLVPVTPLPTATTDPFFGSIEVTDGAEPDHSTPTGAVGPDGLAGPRRWVVNQYHFDAVTRLPPDAELLVTGERYPHQGFRVGPAAWAVQYHPEVSTADFADWLASGVKSGELEDDVSSLLDPVRSGAVLQQRTAAAHAQALLDLTRSGGAQPYGGA